MHWRRHEDAAMSHEHQHDQHDQDDQDDESVDSATFWEERYRGGRQWSGRPNQLLVEQVEPLAPGSALDLGCGEGGDAIWLAGQGWAVTAVDIATAALELGAEHAAEQGVAERITWEQHDLDESFPEGTFDVVSACYLHSPVALAREQVLRRAAAAVAPGGHLVVVGHAGPPTWSTPDHQHHDATFPTTDDVLAALDLPEAEWSVVRQEVANKPSRSPEGVEGTRPDNVLDVRRRG
jgi:SAM-dependent methyltransferase